MRALVLLSTAVLLIATATAASAGDEQKADGVTLSVRPLINPQMVSGSVASGRAGQKVTIQFKQCGLFPVAFRDVSEVTTLDGGSWSDDLGASTNGVFVPSPGMRSAIASPVQVRADVRLSPRPPGLYEVEVVATLSYWRKRVLLQRFDRRKRTWITVRPLVLENQFVALVSSGQRLPSSRPSSQSGRRSARYSRSTKPNRASSRVTATSCSRRNPLRERQIGRPAGGGDNVTGLDGPVHVAEIVEAADRDGSGGARRTRAERAAEHPDLNRTVRAGERPARPAAMRVLSPSVV